MRSLSAAWLQEHLQILVAKSFTSVGFVVCSGNWSQFSNASSFREAGLCAIAQRRSLLVAAMDWRVDRFNGMSTGEAKKNFKEEEEEPHRAERKTLRASRLGRKYFFKMLIS